MKIFGFEITRAKNATKTIEVQGERKVITPGPSSRRDTPVDILPMLKSTLRELKPGFEFEVIPLIRKLEKINPDMTQAFNDLVTLANTGHKIKFDADVPADKVDEMRQFLKDSARKWVPGVVGADPLVSKIFRQIIIAGANAVEFVPNMQLDNLEEVRFLYPERIRWVVEKRTNKLHPYQEIKNNIFYDRTKRTHKRLNTDQFIYAALNGDTEIPYGTPPYLASLRALATQGRMIDNIDYVVATYGIMGWLNASMDKPDQMEGESDEAYRQRMTDLLGQFKDRSEAGFRDGINVGFKDEHEYEFNATAKNAQGISDIFDINEQQVASALRYDQAFMGRSSTETMVTILFTKMLSQLANIQNIVKEVLEFGYKLALRLRGYKFDTLEVEFNKSTITDTLKYQQAREILIRNLRTLYADGIIGQEQYADELGYPEPDQKEPRVPIDPEKIADDEVKRKEREKGKDKSDRVSRDKKAPQGKVRKINN